MDLGLVDNVPVGGPGGRAKLVCDQGWRFAYNGSC